jgi:hypothetical protein
MGFLDKAKAAAEAAATKTKEGVAEMQTKRELGQAYDELGKATFALIESGEVANETLAVHAEKIRDLKKQLEAAEEPVAV